MMLPFTVEQFLDVFAQYNQAIWPMQVILYLFAGAAVCLALVPNSVSNRVIAALLGSLWLWMGVVYHLKFFSRINKAAYGFGVLCIIQAGFFLFAGIVGRDLTFKARHKGIAIVGGLFIVYAVLIYPALGEALGHKYPYSPTFGAPCPTTIFTFGLLLWAGERVPRYVLWIPLFWSLLGLSAAASLGILQDAGLPVAGITGTILIFWRNWRRAKPMPASAHCA